ncbi:hypothetical protein M9H77_35144 [Catharanthus roseus]|uniref:Uncharacterized protein n=1 Tax=Catharanthus roseus TaxID=4058 RepID=A0ACB9ZPX3_CATRO|nr:hypothetical protein M9H77_35144 [Catharanthus roseus]
MEEIMILVLSRIGQVEFRVELSQLRPDLPSTLTPFPTGSHYDTCAPGSSTQPPLVPFRSRPPLPSHQSHTPVLYEAYGSAHPHSQPPPAVYDPYLAAPTVRPHIPYRSSAQEQLGVDFFLQMVGAVQPDSSYSTHGYAAGDYGVSSSEPFMGRQSADLRFEGNWGLGEEPDRRADDGGDGDGYDDDDDDDDDDDSEDSEDVGDEEQPVPLAPVASASGSDGRPRHRKVKGLADSFMSVMSKISGSRNKRPDKARDVPAPT